MSSESWDCGIGTDAEDHDWEYLSDWYGDPDVINGTCTFYFKRCRECGKEEECSHSEYRQSFEPDPDYAYELSREAKWDRDC